MSTVKDQLNYKYLADHYEKIIRTVRTDLGHVASVVNSRVDRLDEIEKRLQQLEQHMRRITPKCPTCGHVTHEL